MHFVGSALLESLSLWERWHCEAMTERASPARKSRCAAMGRLFVRAMLSLCLCFTCSGLALSGASRQLSQRESPWHFAKLYLFARGSPTRGNNDDRRQWRKQGVVVGAAASKTQAKRCGCWVPQPGCGAPLADRASKAGRLKSGMSQNAGPCYKGQHLLS